MAERLDTALVARGLCATRNRAKASILDGNVTVNGMICRKPAQCVAESDRLHVTQPIPYVGRGGLKLAYALATFQISPAGYQCLDIGASTGGFTDCLLQNGAAHVLAVDVGHDQLAPELRADVRVTALDGMDIRALPSDTEGLPADLAVCDASFISLKLILPVLPPLLCVGARAIVLVKPQFEAGRQDIGKHGIVRDKKVHQRVLREVRAAAAAAGFQPLADCESPVKGGSGNTEFLLLLEKQCELDEDS